MTMTPSEQRDVEQALSVADGMNEYVVSRPIKTPARIQFIAHIIAALGLARMNGIDYKVVQSTMQKMNREMNRTAKAIHASKKPKLSVVSSSIQSAIDDDQGNNP